MSARKSSVSISRKLVLANVAMCLLLVAAGVLSLLCVRAVDRNHASLQAMTATKGTLQLLLRGVNESILTEGSSSSRAMTVKALADFEARFAALAPQLAATAADKDRAAALPKEWQQVKAQIQLIMEKKRMAPDDDVIMIGLGKLVTASTAFMGHLDQIANEFEASGEAASVTTYRVLGITFALAVMFVLLVSGALYLLLSRRQKALQIASTLAAGDLSSSIDTSNRYGDGQLMQALEGMNGNLQTVVGEVRRGTAAIAQASEQIAAGNLELSSRTEEQASALQQTSASVEGLRTIASQNAENAQRANEMAADASAAAVQGGAVVDAVVETMASINTASRKIVDIISVIDGIAFQTNILALNAAVEAARAGDQGRGFAVVAAEVRSLAQRSAAAAREIKGLIGDSVAKADAGTKLVAQAGASMTNIVTGIQRVTEFMNQIAQASTAQNRGIQEVHAAIGQIDHVTQQNAGLVEEAAAATEAMRQQAAALAAVVGAFQLHGADRGDAPAAGTAASGAAASARDETGRTGGRWASRPAAAPLPSLR